MNICKQRKKKIKLFIAKYLTTRKICFEKNVYIRKIFINFYRIQYSRRKNRG